MVCGAFGPVPRGISGAPPLYPLSVCQWGFQPHTLSYFLFVQKVTKNTFKGGGCSDSPSPLKNRPTHNGFSRGLRPLAKEATPLAPRECPAPNGILGGYAGDSKGGLAPPFVSLRGVVLRRGTQSKVSPS